MDTMIDRGVQEARTTSKLAAAGFHPWQKNMGYSTASLRSALTDDRWTKAIFYRDPLDRFLSAYLSKCTDGHDEEWDRNNICKPIFGSRSPTFAHAAAVVSRPGFSMPSGLAGDHWRLQKEFCAGYRGYDLVYLLDRSTAAHDVASMMRRVGYSDPSLEYSYRYHFPQRRTLGEHETHAGAHIAQFYSSQSIVQGILKYLAPDYRYLGLAVPAWAVEKAGAQFVQSLGL